MDKVLNIVCTIYNFFSNIQSQESSFFLMFGRYVYLPTQANLLQSKLRYIADASALLSVEMLRKAYTLLAVNLKKKT